MAFRAMWSRRGNPCGRGRAQPDYRESHGGAEEETQTMHRALPLALLRDGLLEEGNGRSAVRSPKKNEDDGQGQEAEELGVGQADAHSQQGEVERYICRCAFAELLGDDPADAIEAKESEHGLAIAMRTAIPEMQDSECGQIHQGLIDLRRVTGWREKTGMLLIRES